MSCERFRDEIPALLYGELDDARSREMAEHLALCSKCRKERDELTRARDWLDHWSEPESLPLPRAEPRRALSVRAAIVGVAAGLLTFTGLLLLQPRPEAPPAGPAPEVLTLLREIAREEVHESLRFASTGIDTLIETRDQGMVRWVLGREELYRAELTRLHLLTDALYRESALEAGVTRRALEDVVSLVAAGFEYRERVPEDSDQEGGSR